MLTLKNLSKYYSRSGAVALGLRKINLTLTVGEFVTVVGESGSGKSTLLNVIGGLDTYEEGEMLVNGDETSHYSVEDWESYRKKYIGFVFQNYNIIESYTVVQNVESALIISGYDPVKRRDRALEIIDRVGLTSFKDMKTSKLSGGQMQRTVIARALAKDSPIILCDEPTGNLDSKTSKQIIDLLYEISKDKLVIIVTHNFKEVEEVASRKLTLHDGHLVEDQILKETIQKDLVDNQGETNKVSYKDSFLFAFKNIMATPVKTLLIFMVLLLLTLSSAFIYGSMLNFKDDNAEFNQNSFFKNSIEERIILRNKDYTAFTQSDLDELADNQHVLDVITGDVALDVNIIMQFSNNHNKYNTNAKIMPDVLIDKDQLTHGRLPQGDNEIVINTAAIRNGVKVKEVLNQTFNYIYKNTLDALIYSTSSNQEDDFNLTIVGITEDKDLGEVVYLSDDYLKQISDMVMINYQLFTYQLGDFENIPIYPNIFQDGYFSKETPPAEDEIIINASLANSYALVNNLDLTLGYDEIIGQILTLKAEGLYEINKIDFKISAVIDNQQVEEDGKIYLSKDGIYQLAKEEKVYQVSLIVDGNTHANRLLNKLDAEYEVIYPYGTLNPISYLLSVLKLVLYSLYLVFFIGICFFITYFILRNIIASKRSDYIILRSIGASKQLIKKITLFEFLIISTSTYIMTLIILLLSHFFEIEIFISIFKYYRFLDYLAIYGILLILVLLLTRRFNKRLFSSSVMLTFKGEESL